LSEKLRFELPKMPKVPKLPKLPKIMERAFSTNDLISNWQ
jgi:hypothetical protein